MKCTVCGSESTIFNPKQNKYFCCDCNSLFEEVAQFKKLRVFVSYGHDEYSPFARGVAEQLREKGHEVWFDESRLKVGNDWESYIEEGLEWINEDPINGRIVLIMTPYSVRRPDGYCLNEIAKALDNRLRIIPVMLVWATPPLSIYRLQYLDLQNSPNKREITSNFHSDISKICDSLENDSYLDIEGKSAGLMSKLDPLDFSADLVLNQEWFTGREWVFDEIREWLSDSEASRMFWITGVPGIGKTAIATKLLQKFPNIVAFHLCRRSHSEKASPRRAICSIAYQLTTQLPEYREILSHIDIKAEIDRCNEASLFDTLITQPLNKVVKNPAHPLVILIDGLDEATVNHKNVMAHFIASEFDRLPTWLRVIITSRPDQEVMVPLQGYNPWILKSKSASNIEDMERYIDSRLAAYRDDKSYEKAKRQIVNNANGIFLYAQLMCDEIVRNAMSLDEHKRFPQKLGGFFLTYFETKFADINRYRNGARVALRIMAAAFDPLTYDELMRLAEWDDDMMHDFLKSMGSFIRISPEGTVISFHASLFEWLSDRSKSDDYFIDRVHGDRIIANSALASAEYSDYDLRHLVKHMVLAGLYEEHKPLLDERFMAARERRFKPNELFNILMLDIEYIDRFMGGTTALADLYRSPIFQSLILRNAIYFFEQNYYKRLDVMGFDKFVESQMAQGDKVSNDVKCLMLYYLYNIYDIQRAAKVQLPIMSRPAIEALSERMLTNYRFAYEMSGSCERISGNFERAKLYTDTAVECAILLGNEISEITTRCVYARSEIFMGDIASAMQHLEEMCGRAEAIVAEMSIDDELPKMQHILSGSLLIYVEQLLNTNRLEPIERLLTTLSRVFQNPNDNSRYLSRYLYMNARYALQIGDELRYKRYEEALSPYDMNKRGGRLFAHKAIYLWLKGMATDNREMLAEAYQFMTIFLERAYERYDIEIYAEGVALHRLLSDTLNITRIEEHPEVAKFEYSISMRSRLLQDMVEVWRC